MIPKRLLLVTILLALPASAHAFQGPPMVGGGHVQPTGGGAGGGNKNNRYPGPGDTAPSGQGGESSEPSAPALPTPPASSTPVVSAPPAASPGMPTPVSLSTESDDGWWLWWEYNKMEFLRPHRMGMWGFPTTGLDDEIDLRGRLRAARDRLEPVLLQALSDPDLKIRAAAAVALSRVGGDASVEPLLRLLADPSADVREHAILALGAGASGRAVQPLLALARFGTPVEGARERVSPYACPLAIVALAVGRRAGFDSSLDAEVANVVRSRTGTEREAVIAAALIYQSLAPCPEFAKLALEMVDDSNLPPAVRCRAVESLRHSSDSGVPERLAKLLTGPRLDLRRSAALALGTVRDPGALPALLAAFAAESEPLTRGFILISIGRQGGEKARDGLLQVVREGEPGMRKWAALALGILRRTAGDPEVGKAIREAAARERNQSAMAAYWIAGGLARDEGSRPAISEGLASAADPTQRMYAATSLALLGGEASQAALRSRIELDDSPLVRASIASALGYLGLPHDARALAGTLQTLREPGLQGLIATALSFHGSVEAFQFLSELSRSSTGPPVRRAAALEGLGMMLADSQPLVFAEISRQANYTVFPEWVKGLFQLTL